MLRCAALTNLLGSVSYALEPTQQDPNFICVGNNIHVLRKVKDLVNLFVRRLANSTVAWSLAFNSLRLALGLLLLPLLLRFLSAPDLGMYYLFLNLNAIIIVLDLGFSPTIGRFITYAMGGARSLSAQGLAEGRAAHSPNYSLLWELLITARVFYRYLAWLMILLLGAFGSFMVWQKVGETSSPHLTWAAWALSVLAVAAETYFNIWNIFLRNIDQVLAATRISMLAYSLRLVLAAIILVCGGGLLGLPIASFLTSFVIRNLSRRKCLMALASSSAPKCVDWRANLRIMWPNSWRLGLYFAGIYLSTNANVLLCSSAFGLAANAKYGLSLQMMSFVSGLAAVWPSVKWPLVGQFVARQDVEALRRTLWPRVCLQMITFVCLAAAAIVLGPAVIRFFGRDKEMLASGWLILLSLNGFLEGHCSTWNTFISLWNRLPMLWSSLATNVVSLALNLALVHWVRVDAGVLVLGPLLAGAAFNHWFWPSYGARILRLSWFQFLQYGLRWANR